MNNSLNLRKNAVLLVKIFILFLGITFSLDVVAQKNGIEGGAQTNIKKRKKELAKKEEEAKAEEDAAIKEMKKTQWKQQDKATRKRMKKAKKSANQYNSSKKGFFFGRLFK